MKPPKILNNNGHCLLRFTFQGTRYSLTTGYYDNPNDYRKAQKIAIQIAEDVDNGLFTGDMDAYRDNATGMNKARIKNLIDWRLLSSNDPIFMGISKHIKTYPHEIRNTVEAEKFFNSLELSTASKRRYYTALRSFKELKGIFDFPIIRPKDELVKEIDPFTELEVKRILDHVKLHPLYPFIAFLAYTGCRPGEAKALTWDCLSEETSTVRIVASLDSQGVIKTTKTGKTRTVPIPKVLLELLLEKYNGDEDHDAVFPESHDKSKIRWTWKATLKALGIRYRPLYNLRHSFITHCLVKGVTVATVAKWVGNSPKIIYTHYAGSLDSESLPELY